MTQEQKHELAAMFHSTSAKAPTRKKQGVPSVSFKLRLPVKDVKSAMSNASEKGEVIEYIQYLFGSKFKPALAYQATEETDELSPVTYSGKEVYEVNVVFAKEFEIKKSQIHAFLEDYDIDADVVSTKDIPNFRG